MTDSFITVLAPGGSFEGCESQLKNTRVVSEIIEQSEI